MTKQDLTVQSIWHTPSEYPKCDKGEHIQIVLRFDFGCVGSCFDGDIYACDEVDNCIEWCYLSDLLQCESELQKAREEIEELKTKQDEYEFALAEIDNLKQQLADKDKRIECLENTLKFYANKESWYLDDDGFTCVAKDKGKKAIGGVVKRCAAAGIRDEVSSSMTETIEKLFNLDIMQNSNLIKFYKLMQSILNQSVDDILCSADAVELI